MLEGKDGLSRCVYRKSDKGIRYRENRILVQLGIEKQFRKRVFPICFFLPP